MGLLRDLGLDATLELIGDGPSRPSIESEITSLKLEERVHLLGWKSSDEVAEALRRTSVFVLPSFAEGLPVVIMEAMALGRPVISTYVAGIPELVIPGENGWLVPAGDVQALVNAMRQAMNTPVQRLQEMGAAGRVRVFERHSIQTEANKLARFFSSGNSA
jgi:colanic acid/amylovoran biosynthesis glycosyltransferase